MSPQVYQAFESLCARHPFRGPVLEVGVAPGPDSLLRMPCLRDMPDKTGIHLAPPGVDEGSSILQGNANAMPHFADGSFGLVLCNSTLEHDPFFWKTLQEIRRITASGGLFIVGVPGYADMGIEHIVPGPTRSAHFLRRLMQLLGGPSLPAGTLTLGEHHFPGDYYRFSEMALRDVLLEGWDILETLTIMHPPRLLGCGRKP